MGEQDRAHDTGVDYVDVRALGVAVGCGVRHWVKREPDQTIQGFPALCGETASEGWLPWPSRTAHDCGTCVRRLDEAQAEAMNSQEQGS